MPTVNIVSKTKNIITEIHVEFEQGIKVMFDNSTEWFDYIFENDKRVHMVSSRYKELRSKIKDAEKAIFEYMLENKNFEEVADYWWFTKGRTIIELKEQNII